MTELKTRITSLEGGYERIPTFYGDVSYENRYQNITFQDVSGREVLVELKGDLLTNGGANDNYYITIETEKERNERLEAEALTISIFNCSSCGQTHRDLKIQKLSNEGPLGSHWTPCPTNGDPVFVKFDLAAPKEEICDTIP